MSKRVRLKTPFYENCRPEPVHHGDGADYTYYPPGASVEVSTDGVFITIETDAYEGSAMFHWKAAPAIRAALDKAIEAAEARRKLIEEEGRAV